MSDDLISLIIYVALGLIGVIASAYKNKMKKQQQSAGTTSTATRYRISLPADPQRILDLIWVR